MSLSTVVIMFNLKATDIPRLAKANHFPLSGSGMMFFGLRGSLPVLDDAGDFKEEHPIELCQYDHIHPSCTIGQYSKDLGIALFPGSTVPSRHYVKKAMAERGSGTNMLLTGYYNDYRKGWHRRSSWTGHEAFRQESKLPVRRSADDLDYDNDDRVEYTRPFDNIHAAWSMSVYQENFASAGCQVVLGYPECEKRKLGGRLLPEAGPWGQFRTNAYSMPQDRFDYMLLTGRDAMRVTYDRRSKVSPRLRYGSQGDLVITVQKKLGTLQYYEGRIDGDFGARTLRAILEFQEAFFGSNADDGIVGPITATALGVDWPKS